MIDFFHVGWCKSSHVTHVKINIPLKRYHSIFELDEITSSFSILRYFDFVLFHDSTNYTKILLDPETRNCDVVSAFFFFFFLMDQTIIFSLSD